MEKVERQLPVGTADSKKCAAASAHRQHATDALSPSPLSQAGIGNRALGRIIQAKLAIGQPGDMDEQEADRIADTIMRGAAGNAPGCELRVDIPAQSRSNRATPPAISRVAPTFSGSGGGIQRKCATCEEEERIGSSGGLTEVPDDMEMVGGVAESRLIQKKETGQRAPLASGLQMEASVQRAVSGGEPIPQAVRTTFEQSLQYDFSEVRIHTGSEAALAGKALGALAFTTGKDIAFGEGRFAPCTTEGRRLLAHELTHVAQQGKARPLSSADTRVMTTTVDSNESIPVQRDLAVEPPESLAVANILSAAQVEEAIRFNQFRFKDPFDIRTVRDVLGLSPVPAIIDEEFILAVVQWQAEHRLFQDGKLGPGTTRTFLVELRAEREPALANLLAQDNFVTTSDVFPPTFNACPVQPSFRWDVSFNTSMRSGFIIQDVRNAFNPVHCDVTPYVGPRPTPRYWEVWQVDANGVVTPSVGATNDMWRLGLCHHAAGPPRCANKDSRGTWTKSGTFFTVLHLPAAVGFAVGNVPDAGILQSTAVAPNPDDLGVVAGSRQIGGTWDCCPPANTHTRT
jgi:hypothetical protein